MAGVRVADFVAYTKHSRPVTKPGDHSGLESVSSPIYLISPPAGTRAGCSVPHAPCPFFFVSRWSTYAILS
jgi:hypothetical protein